MITDLQFPQTRAFYVRVYGLHTHHAAHTHGLVTHTHYARTRTFTRLDTLHLTPRRALRFTALVYGFPVAVTHTFTVCYRGLRGCHLRTLGWVTFTRARLVWFTRYTGLRLRFWLPAHYLRLPSHGWFWIGSGYRGLRFAVYTRLLPRLHSSHAHHTHTLCVTHAFCYTQDCVVLIVITVLFFCCFGYTLFLDTFTRLNCTVLIGLFRSWTRCRLRAGYRTTLLRYLVSCLFTRRYCYRTVDFTVAHYTHVYLCYTRSPLHTDCRLILRCLYDFTLYVTLLLFVYVYVGRI